MARPKKNKEEVKVEAPVVEQTAQEEVAQEETKEPTCDCKEKDKEFDREFLCVLKDAAYVLLKSAEELEVDTAKACVNAKWYNRRKRHKVLAEATKAKLCAAGTVYYLEKNLKEINKKK